MIRETSGPTEVPTKIFGFIIDLPSVMQLTRILLWGLKDGESSCIVFTYGCVCHVLSNLVKGFCSHLAARTALLQTISLVQLSKNMHVVSDLLANAKRN